MKYCISELLQEGGYLIKPRMETSIGIIIFIIAIVLSGCDSTPEPDAVISSLTNTPNTTDSPSDTQFPPKLSVTIDMILIPAGEFEMGQNPDTGLEECQKLFEPWPNREGKKCKRNGFEDEEPVHLVYLDDYYIDKFEVTTADYQLCVEVGACDPPKSSSTYSHEDYYRNPKFADYPVVYISWFDAKSFCEWRGSRLPTEAEWEKSARGTDGRIYPWGNSFDGSIGNFCDRDYEFIDGFKDNSPVGYYPEGTSPYGVMDLAGNAWEWVADWYGFNYFSSSPGENPQGPPDGSQRVLKGGTRRCEGFYDVRAADRIGWFPEFKYDYIGFRCAVSSPK